MLFCLLLLRYPLANFLEPTLSAVSTRGQIFSPLSFFSISERTKKSLLYRFLSVFCGYPWGEWSHSGGYTVCDNLTEKSIQEHFVLEGHIKAQVKPGCINI